MKGPSPKPTPARRYASFARELGADLGKINGTGVKGRITQDDVKAHVKRLLTAASTAAPVSPLPRVPVVDFAQVWGCRDQTAFANPKDLRYAAAGKLAESAACDSARGCGYHRS